jgi:hypothetical protein
MYLKKDSLGRVELVGGWGLPRPPRLTTPRRPRARIGGDFLDLFRRKPTISDKELEQVGEAGVRAAGLAGNISWTKADRERALSQVARKISTRYPGLNADGLARKWIGEYTTRQGITFE